MLMKRILLVIFALISLYAFSQLQVKEGSFRYVPGGVIDDKAITQNMSEHCKRNGYNGTLAVTGLFLNEADEKYQ